MKFVLMDLLKSLYNKKYIIYVGITAMVIFTIYINPYLALVVFAIITFYIVVFLEAKYAIDGMVILALPMIIMLILSTSQEKYNLIGEIEVHSYDLNSMSVEYKDKILEINIQACSNGTHKLYRVKQEFLVFKMEDYVVKCNKDIKGDAQKVKEVK